MTSDERQRVRERAWPVVLEFCRTHKTFFSRELDEFVEAKLGKIAPDTAARRLGELREKKYLNYHVDKNHLFHVTEGPSPDLQIDFDFEEQQRKEVGLNGNSD
jgi:hypothetical protein